MNEGIDTKNRKKRREKIECTESMKIGRKKGEKINWHSLACIDEHTRRRLVQRKEVLASET
jgi:hypothetical protein